MAFQIKSFTSIAAGAINLMRSTQRAITDFNIGSVARTLIEAVAIEIDQAYQQMLNGLKEAIPVATYNSFNFTRQEAIPATGVIRVTVTVSADPVTVEAGTVFSSVLARTTYITTGEAIIDAGDTFVDVFVSAQTPGLIGNLAAGSAFSLTPMPDGFLSASNAGAFVNGQDVETDEQRKQRFALYVSTLARGTVAALEYGAKTVIRRDATGAEVERVRAVSVVEPYVDDPLEPISLVMVYIHNGVGSTTSDLVLLANQVIHGYVDGATGDKIPGWKAAGVKVEVLAAAEQPLDVTGDLTVGPGYVEADVADAVELALGSYIASLDIGKPFVHSEAVFIIKSINGVVDFVFATPAGNVTCDSNEKIVAGTITVNV